MVPIKENDIFNIVQKDILIRINNENIARRLILISRTSCVNSVVTISNNIYLYQTAKQLIKIH